MSDIDAKLRIPPALDTARESMWYVNRIELDRTRLPDRAITNRSKDTVVFVHQAWFGAREMAAVFYSVPTESVDVEVTTGVVGGTYHTIRREGPDLVCDTPGFFDAENEPAEDEWCESRPIDLVAHGDDEAPAQPIIDTSVAVDRSTIVFCKLCLKTHEVTIGVDQECAPGAWDEGQV